MVQTSLLLQGLIPVIILLMGSTQRNKKICHLLHSTSEVQSVE